MSESFEKKFFSLINKDFVKKVIIFYSFNVYTDDKLNNNNFFITKDDSVYGFGDNKYGLLGLGHKRKVTQPKLINQLCNKQIIQFNNGYSHCIARSFDGKLYSFGSNDCYQLGNKIKNKNNRPKIIESLINENVIQVSCGSFHTIVLTQNGEVFGWGRNRYGQIGINSKVDLLSIPTKIIGFNGEKIQSISCGFNYSMALTINGNVFSWGCNSFGQLGIICTNYLLFPQIIKIEDQDVLFKKISCGSTHSLLLSTNGDIYSFGWNENNQLGYKTHNEKHSTIPRIIDTTPMKLFSDICCHFYHNISTAISSTDGFCYIWGKCGNQDIKSIKKTEYKSCEEAILDITDSTVIALNLRSDLRVKNNFFSNNYLLNKIISKGRFGEVFNCFNKKTKFLSAVKIIEIKIKEIDKIMREREIISKLKNESIVGYKQSWIEANKNNVYFLYIEMELCLKTINELNHNIFEELNCKTSICESVLGYYIMSELIKEVIEGLEYLHKNNIIHRDLKPTNILINDIVINGKCVRIADFGLSRKQSDKSMTGNVGSLKYMSPELKQSSNRISNNLIYGYKVDIYSLGVIIEEMIVLSSLTSNLYKDKVENLIKIKNNMISHEYDLRLNCDEILRKANDWSITLEDLTQLTELTKCFSKNFDNVSMDVNFVQYFLRHRLKSYSKELKNSIVSLSKIKTYLNDRKDIELLLERFNKLNIYSHY